jgi:hypothetical protein
MYTMKLRPVFALLTYTLFVLPACTKSTGSGAPASITVINAIPTANNLVLLLGNDPPRYFATAQSAGYGGAAQYSPASGRRAFSVFQLSDTTRSVFTGSADLAGGGIYSLFLLGDTTRPDTLFIKDNIVNYTSDSAGVRFVNLSVDGKALSVNAEGGAAGDFATLSYKGVSGFRQFNADMNGPGSYNFEIRDPVSGDLLTTFSWSYTDHKNNTVIIAGSVDPASSTPLNVFQVNNF